MNIISEILHFKMVVVRQTTLLHLQGLFGYGRKRTIKFMFNKEMMYIIRIKKKS